MDVHDNQAAGALGDMQFLEYGGQIGVGRVVHGHPEPVHRHFRGNTEDRGFAAYQPVRDTEDYCSTTAVGHADGCGYDDA